MEKKKNIFAVVFENEQGTVTHYVTRDKALEEGLAAFPQSSAIMVPADTIEEAKEEAIAMLERMANRSRTDLLPVRFVYYFN